MLHYSCDVCGKDLTDGRDARFVVQMEVTAAHDPELLQDEDLHEDHLAEISQLLRDSEDLPADPAPDYKKLRFDLCTACHRRFLADPLNREVQKFDFSPN